MRLSQRWIGGKLFDQHPALPGQLQSGQLLEFEHGGAGQLAIAKQVEPGDERGAGIIAFEIVGRIEQILSAGLALPACQCAEAVEPPGNRAGEAQLALAVGRARPKQRRGGLMGAVGPPKALNGPVRPPARLQQEVNPPLLVVDVKAGMIGAPGAARRR